MGGFRAGTPPDEVSRRLRLLCAFFPELEQLRVTFADRVWSEARLPVEERLRQSAAWARWLGCASPAGAYAGAAATLARTDRGDYWHFLDGARAYRRQLIAYLEQGVFDSPAWLYEAAEHQPLRGRGAGRAPGAGAEGRGRPAQPRRRPGGPGDPRPGESAGQGAQSPGLLRRGQGPVPAARDRGAGEHG
ncbi:MAG: DUF3526 domain-containing protein [Candidatus Latescibacterota bacterium]